MSDRIKRFSPGKLPVLTLAALFAASLWGAGSPLFAQEREPERTKKIERKIEERIPHAQKELIQKRLEALKNRKNKRARDAAGRPPVVRDESGRKIPGERPLQKPAEKKKKNIPSENLLKEKEKKETKKKEQKKPVPKKDQQKKTPAKKNGIKAAEPLKTEKEIKVASIIKVAKLKTFKPEFTVKRDIFSPDLMAPVRSSRQSPPPPPPPVVETPEDLEEETPLENDIEMEIRQSVFYEGYVIKQTRNFALISASGEFYAVGVGDLVLEKVKIIKIEKKSITVEVNSTVFEIQLKGDDDQ